MLRWPASDASRALTAGGTWPANARPRRLAQAARRGGRRAAQIVAVWDEVDAPLLEVEAATTLLSLGRVLHRLQHRIVRERLAARLAEGQKPAAVRIAEQRAAAGLARQPRPRVGSRHARSRDPRDSGREHAAHRLRRLVVTDGVDMRISRARDQELAREVVDLGSLRHARNPRPLDAADAAADNDNGHILQRRGAGRIDDGRVRQRERRGLRRCCLVRVNAQRECSERERNETSAPDKGRVEPGATGRGTSSRPSHRARPG